MQVPCIGVLAVRLSESGYEHAFVIKKPPEGGF
jgi:hypothetical protein